MSLCPHEDDGVRRKSILRGSRRFTTTRQGFLSFPVMTRPRARAKMSRRTRGTSQGPSTPIISSCFMFQVCPSRVTRSTSFMLRPAKQTPRALRPVASLTGHREALRYPGRQTWPTPLLPGAPACSGLCRWAPGKNPRRPGLPPALSGPFCEFHPWSPDVPITTKLEAQRTGLRRWWSGQQGGTERKWSWQNLF